MTFATLDSMRREEDPAFDLAGKGKNADWKGVVATSTAALSDKSKDLQLAAYLTEGLARTQGYAGLREGLRLTRELVERHWDGLHPGFEDGEILPGVRAKWLSWIGGSNDFRAAVKRIPITGGVGSTPRSWLDYEESRRVDEASTKTDRTAFDELVQSGRISGADWKSALGATPPDHLSRVAQDVKACTEEVQALNRLCEEKLGSDAPSLIPLDELLQECQALLDGFLAGMAPAETDSGGDGAPQTAGSPSRGASGPIGTRDDAYRRLREVADFLRRTEPHSPVSYLIDRAVRWGQLPFQDLLRDVLKHNDDARTTVLETLGLAEPEE
jgi:type VI secretion system protein ImpA